MGELTSIVFKPQDAAPVSGGYTRLPLQEATLKAGRGIEGDTKGGGVRQLNIMCAESVDALAREGFHAAPGQLGEQLIVSGLPIDTLAVGAVLQIGPTARVQVVEPRVGCGRFEAYQGRSRHDAARRMGIMARVLAGGKIYVGAGVQVVDENPTLI